MNLDVALIFIILITVIVLFVTEWVRLDIVPLLVPVTLCLAGLTSAEEVFAGFSSTAVVTVAALFVISAGLVRSGVVDRAADSLKRFTGDSRFRLILASTALPGSLAGFVNVSATVFFFVPTVMRMALQSNVPRSRLLLPLVATCLLGANLTLIGASHNLVVNSLLNKSTGLSFSFFEFLPLGIILITTAVIYNFLLGWRLLPGETSESAKKHLDFSEDLVKVYDLDDRLWELWVKDKSPAVGKTLSQAGLGQHYGLSVLAVVREGGQAVGQLPAGQEELALQAEDVLLVLGRETKIRDLAGQEGLTLAGQPRGQDIFSLSTAELVEVIVPPRSPVIGESLTSLHFRQRTGLSGIAMWRDGKPRRTNVGSQSLREGDGLLLFGDRKKIRRYEPGRDFTWLHPLRQDEAPQELRHLGPLAAFTLALVVASAALGWLPIPVAALAGAASMILLGILSPVEAYGSIEWRTIILIGCLYPLGIAMVNSGASALLARLLVTTLGHLGPAGVLGGVALVSLILTQPLHNVAAAVIMTPVALDAAHALAVNPKTFAMAVIVGVSAAFLLPVGHPTPLLVKMLGNYESRDYLRFGLGLGLLVLLVIVLAVPRVWPF